MTIKKKLDSFIIVLGESLSRKIIFLQQKISSYFLKKFPPKDGKSMNEKTNPCTSPEDLISNDTPKSHMRDWEVAAYGVATITRLLKIIGLFCKRAL